MQGIRRPACFLAKSRCALSVTQQGGRKSGPDLARRKWSNQGSGHGAIQDGGHESAAASGGSAGVDRRGIVRPQLIDQLDTTRPQAVVGLNELGAYLGTLPCQKHDICLVRVQFPDAVQMPKQLDAKNLKVSAREPVSRCARSAQSLNYEVFGSRLPEPWLNGYICCQCDPLKCIDRRSTPDRCIHVAGIGIDASSVDSHPGDCSKEATYAVQGFNNWRHLKRPTLN